ncbi:hypothetical protein VPH35_078410 [Triticum aestivum]
MFMGVEPSPTAPFTWQWRASLRCRLFAWLAIKERCWTSDGLARRGLPHQNAIPLCGQHHETITHLLIKCVFTKQIWLWFKVDTGRIGFEPRTDETLEDWCIRQDQDPKHRRTTHAKCLLGLWMIWKHRSDMVFNGATPSVSTYIDQIEKEGELWAKVGLISEGENPAWSNRE